MSRYVRAKAAGGTYFFTLITEGRAPLFKDAAARNRLHQAIAACGRGRPFELVAIALLPDHLHAIWTLPDGNEDFSTRWDFIKSHFTHAHLASGGEESIRSESRIARRNRGVWQRRFWEHLCRDDADLGRHVEYVHSNAVKHGLVRCPHDWAHSSFHRWVSDGRYRRNWCCVCDATLPAVPDFSWACVDME